MAESTDSFRKYPGVLCDEKIMLLFLTLFVFLLKVCILKPNNFISLKIKEQTFIEITLLVEK